MKRSTALAWGVFGVVAVLYVVAIVLGLLGSETSGLILEDLVAMGFLGFPLVGAPIAARQPGNAIGWVLLGIGIHWGLLEALTGYAAYSLEKPTGPMPGINVALAFVSFLWIPAVGLMGTFLILLFPDGRPPSPRWRPVVWASAIAIVISSLATVFVPGRFENEGFPDVKNPFGLESLASVIAAVEIGGLFVLLMCILASAAGLVMRFRRSRGQERVQLKWLTTAGAVVGITYVSAMASSFLYLWVTGQDATTAQLPMWLDVGFQIAVASFLLIPLAVGIAILRYRLYDIDLIINRTLVYGALTAFLTTIYLVGVTVLQGLLRPIAGRSGLAVAGSTLAVAALFQPIRNRVQAFVDRRFYRRKYDAAQTIEEFSARLRNEVELDALRTDLLAIIDDVIQPTHASLWLRDPQRT